MDGIGCAVALAAGVGEGSTAVGVGTEYCALEEASQFPALAVASKGMKKYTHIKMFTVKTIHSPTLRNFWRGDLFHAVRRSSIVRCTSPPLDGGHRKSCGSHHAQALCLRVNAALLKTANSVLSPAASRAHNATCMAAKTDEDSSRAFFFTGPAVLG